MSEPRRNDEELTTADLANTSAATQAPKPELVPVPPRQVPDQETSSAQPGPAALFSQEQLGDFRSRWSTIQTGFVDEPRQTVEQADKLVATLMTQLAEGFSNERARLEKQWDQGTKISTEDLRLALQRYRSFFDRLLKV